MLLGLIVARALHFWSVAVLLGGGGFLCHLGADNVRHGRTALRFAAYGTAVTGVAWFIFVFAIVTGGLDTVFDRATWIDFLGSPFGWPWGAHVALCVAAVTVGVRPSPLASFMFGAALAVSQAWLGHAAAGTGAAAVTMVMSYVAHVLAGLGWVGAVTMLLVAVRSPASLHDGLALFSTTGLVLVATILATGWINASFHLASVTALVTTPYGRILVVKTAFFAAMLTTAAFNRVEGHRSPIKIRRIAIGVGLETACGVMVLLAAATLGVTAP